MCGSESCNRPRGGALATLTTPASTISAASASTSASSSDHTLPDLVQLRADLAFHTPGSPGSRWATHARLTPATTSLKFPALRDLSVVIHCTGDLMAQSADCGLFHRFSLHDDDVLVYEDESLELALDQPMSLQVGGEGIIGRRVSVYSGDGVLIAEGIVGFNFLPSASLAV